MCVSITLKETKTSKSQVGGNDFGVGKKEGAGDVNFFGFASQPRCLEMALGSLVDSTDWGISCLDCDRIEPPHVRGPQSKIHGSPKVKGVD